MTLGKLNPMTLSVLLSGGDPLLAYLDELNSKGYIAASYFGDVKNRATYDGTFSGGILRNWYGRQNGANDIVNGTFAADSDWTKGTGWSIAGGVASCDGSQAANTSLTQTSAPLSYVGATYYVEFTVSNYSAGSVRVLAGSGVPIAYQSANGTYSAYFILQGNTSFSLQGNSSFVGDVDNVIARQVGHLDVSLTDHLWGADPGGGVIWNGTTTIGTIANHADLANLTTQAWLFVAAPDSLGESSAAFLMAWEFGTTDDHRFSYSASDVAVGIISTDTVDAGSTSDNNELTVDGSKVLHTMDYDDANALGNGRRIRHHEGINGAVSLLSLATDTAGTGTVLNQATDLYIGNREGTSRTFDGTMYLITCLNANGIAEWDTIYQQLTTLAGV